MTTSGGRDGTGAPRISYRPLATQRLPMAIFVLMQLAVLAVAVYFVVDGVGASGDEARYGSGGTVLIAFWLVGAYLFLVRLGHRLDLEDDSLVWASPLRSRRLPLEDLLEIRLGGRAAVIRTRRRRVQVWLGPGFEDFVDKVRDRAPAVAVHRLP